MTVEVTRPPAIIGESHRRPDALGKVTGATAYPADRIDAGMLHAAVAFSHRPRARLLGIDAASALATPGVVAVITAADIPFNAFGLIHDDQPVLVAVGDEARFSGDKVAVVVAESPDAAMTGVEALVVTWESLPAVTDPGVAMTAGAPIVHADRDSNVLTHVPIRKGDVDRRIRGSRCRVGGLVHDVVAGACVPPAGSRNRVGRARWPPGDRDGGTVAA